MFLRFKTKPKIPTKNKTNDKFMFDVCICIIVISVCKPNV